MNTNREHLLAVLLLAVLSMYALDGQAAQKDQQEPKATFASEKPESAATVTPADKAAPSDTPVTPRPDSDSGSQLDNQPQTGRRESLRVITYNTQFLPGVASHFNKRGHPSYRSKAIGKAVTGFDIIGLNELFDTPRRRELLAEIQNAWGDNYHVVTAPDSQRSFLGIDSGLAIISRKRVVESHSIPFGNGSSVMQYGLVADGLASKGILHARIAIRDSQLLDVVVTHLEAKDASIRERQYDLLSEAIRRYGDDRQPLLLLGDLNTSGGKAQRDSPTSPYSRLLKALNQARPHAPFVDLWPHLHAESGGTSNPGSADGGTRIDYIFLSQDPVKPVLAAVSVEVESFPDKRTTTLSDHAAVKAVLEY